MSLVYLIQCAYHIFRKLLVLRIQNIRECYLLIIFIWYFNVLSIHIVLLREFDRCWIGYFVRFRIYFLVYHLNILILNELDIFIFIILVLVLDWFYLFLTNVFIHYVKSVDCNRMVLSYFGTSSRWINARAVWFQIYIKFYFAQIQMQGLIVFLILVVIIFFFYSLIIFIWFIIMLIALMGIHEILLCIKWIILSNIFFIVASIIILSFIAGWNSYLLLLIILIDIPNLTLFFYLV
jgi:hypothetical protein